MAQDNPPPRKDPVVWTAALILALCSAWLVHANVVTPAVPERMQFEHAILEQNIEAPYRYRILLPGLARAIQKAKLFPGSAEHNHTMSYGLIHVLTFWGIYLSFFYFLTALHTRTRAFAGLALLLAALPLSLTGFYMEGDFLNLLAVTLALCCMVRGYPKVLPLIIFIGALNRVQVLYIPVLYGAFLLARDTPPVKRDWLRLLAHIVGALCVLALVRYFQGHAPNPYTMAFHWAKNTDPGRFQEVILPLWTKGVLPFAVLAGFGATRSSRFIKLALLTLAPYTLLFCLRGHLSELAKYLPAHILLIAAGLGVGAAGTAHKRAR